MATLAGAQSAAQSLLGALTGKSSWFGGPNDPSAQGTPASGIPITTPGIAVNNRATLGGWWAIKAPNGDIGVVRQTDIGPAAWTGRAFDYTYSLLPLFGYTQSNFPTGAQTQGYYLGQSIGDPSFGANFSAALGHLGATKAQSANLTQSLDAGAIMQGGAATVAPRNQTPGTTNPAMGQAPSASEATPVLNVPNPLDALTGIWTSIVGDAKYAAVLVGVLILGALMMFRAFSSGGGGKTRVVPV